LFPVQKTESFSTAATKTVVFNDQLKHVVFSPYWNVPRSIVRNEILPAMNRNPGYLSRNNMEQTGTSGGLPVIRQKPGGSNALGRVKFIFPNSFNIYFHDTPAKSLFQQEQRAFGHGCIRLEEPRQLAEYLLQNQPEWTDRRISDAMNSGTEKWVALKEPVAVAITYFTAWVDADGNLNLGKIFMAMIKRLRSVCLRNSSFTNLCYQFERQKKILVQSARSARIGSAFIHCSAKGFLSQVFEKR
jgi:murein L,D-transpeptidase YcbB/YkuD